MTMTHLTFDTLLRAERAAVNQPVSLLSRIVGRSPTVIEGGQVGSRLRFTALRSPDLRDSALCTAPELLERAEHAFEHGYPVLLYGRFVPIRKDQRTVLELCLTDIQPVKTYTTLLCPTPDELDRARQRWAGLRAACQRERGALLDHVLGEARVLLGLRGAPSPHYLKVQTGIVLQALSGGVLHDGNGRLSVMVFGPPGRGRKTLALLAQLLSPVAMISHGGALTPASLSAQVLRLRDGNPCIDPGMLLRGDGGVVVIEDFQALRRHRDRIQQALCLAAEEGQVPITAGPGLYEGQGREPLHSEVGIYLDLNLEAAMKGHVPGRTGQTLLDSQGFVTDLLSRMDELFCVEAGPDPERSARDSVWADAQRPPPRPVEEDLVQRRRDLQLLVAVVRDELPVVNLDRVADILVDGFFDRGARLEQLRSRSLHASEFIRRGSRSLHKLAVGAARLCGAETAGPLDAQLALLLFDAKIATLAWLAKERQGGG